MTAKQIIDAQKILRKLDETPVKLTRGDGKTCFQVTYDSDTYNDLLNIITAVAKIPIQTSPSIDFIAEYHREKI